MYLLGSLHGGCPERGWIIALHVMAPASAFALHVSMGTFESRCTLNGLLGEIIKFQL